MDYGSVLTYPYEIEDEQGNKINKKLVLVFNPITLINYHNYVGRDFMSDFLEIGFQSLKDTKQLSKPLAQKYENGEDIKLADISEEDFEKLKTINLATHNEFFINLIASMIATREYPKKLDFMDIICDEIPLFLLYDTEFLYQLVDFIGFGIKKNKGLLLRAQQAYKKNA